MWKLRRWSHFRVWAMKQQCGTVPPRHFWRQWCHKCYLSPTGCKVPPGPGAGDFLPQLGCKNITTFHNCPPSRPISPIGTIKCSHLEPSSFHVTNSLSCHTFSFSAQISAHKYNKERKKSHLIWKIKCLPSAEFLEPRDIIKIKGNDLLCTLTHWKHNMQQEKIQM